MKKFYWIFLSLFFATTLTFVSCGSDDEEGPESPETPETPSNPNVPGGEKQEMGIYEQKEFIESTGIEFTNSIKSDDFYDIVRLAEYASEEYADYDTENVDEWFGDCLRDMTEYLGKDKEEYSYYIHQYTNYSRLYILSNFKGSFKATNGAWVKSNADNLSFTFDDQEGNECTIKLTASSNGKKVYIGKSDDYTSWDYDSSLDKYIEYIDVYQNYIIIPENIVLTVTKEGGKLAEIKLTTTMDMDSEYFNIKEDNYSATFTCSINDYTISIDKASYKAQKNAAVSMQIKKGKKILASTSISADGYIKDEEVGDIKNAKISFEIMEKVAVKGYCNDILRLADKIEKAEENEDDEKAFKSYVTDINELLDLGVYYNKSDKKQAYVQIEAVCEDDWGYEYWDFLPVICFDDGTKYNTFDAFFDKDDFKDLINSFNKLVDDFEWLLR